MTTLIAGFALVAACSGGSGTSGGAESGSGRTTTSTQRYPRDGELRLDQIQVIGTHNSYHRRPNPDFAAAAEELVPGLLAAFDYEHRPLTEQLEELGIRQFELDIFADPEGTLYANRKAYAFAGLPPDGGIAELHEPGFKVLHVQEVDPESTCPTLVLCLTEIRTWSDDNPGHVPIFVLIEAKDDPIPDPFEMGFEDPIPIREAELDALDAEIRSVFDEHRLITPDLVRGKHASLAEALEAEGWPALGEVRGKIMFLLDNGGEVADAYRAGHPNLEDRVMFTGDREPGDPTTAFIKMNDPIEDQQAISEAVAAGFIVRTRADADAHLSTEDPSSQRDLALGSGAQLVSTDYPEPGLERFGDYVVRMPDGTTIRCNPISAPAWCTTLDVENPAWLGG